MIDKPMLVLRKSKSANRNRLSMARIDSRGDQASPPTSFIHPIGVGAPHLPPTTQHNSDVRKREWFLRGQVPPPFTSHPTSWLHVSFPNLFMCLPSKNHAMILLTYIVTSCLSLVFKFYFFSMVSFVTHFVLNTVHPWTRVEHLQQHHTKSRLPTMDFNLDGWKVIPNKKAQLQERGNLRN